MELAEAAAVAEEVKDPSINLPRAFIASAVVVTLFYVDISENKREYIVAFDHDILNSIIEQAEIENADIIIMFWHDSKRFKYLFGDVINDVLLSSKSQIALLKGPLPENIKKILVVYNEKENSVHGLSLAKKIAGNTGASIRIISILSPNEDQEQKAKVAEELESLIKKIHIAENCHWFLKIAIIVKKSKYSSKESLNYLLKKHAKRVCTRIRKEKGKD